MQEALGWSEGNDLINSIGAEKFLAERIEAERKRLGLSQAALSDRLAKVNHPLHQSAISKIESPPATDGRRGISIDEAIGFSKVFGVPLGELLLPPASLDRANSWRQFSEAVRLFEEIRALRVGYEGLIKGLRAAVLQDEELGEQVRATRKRSLVPLENEAKRVHSVDGIGWRDSPVYKRLAPGEALVADDIFGEETDND